MIYEEDCMLTKIYTYLLDFYGEQGWWPIFDANVNKTAYYVDSPKNDREAFEISLGAILTQGVAWLNVEKALINLYQKKLLDARSIWNANSEDVALAIQPTGYYNQKTKKIYNFLGFLEKYEFSLSKFSSTDNVKNLRKKLLEVNGIGPETADTILLYALNKKKFVVDTYTKRQFFRLGMLEENLSYDKVQSFCHENFEGNFLEYKEFHALIVKHGKEFCKKNPSCDYCFLREKGICNFKI